MKREGTAGEPGVGGPGVPIDVKPPRKAPEPRGLAITLPAELSDDVRAIAMLGGLGTKAEVEIALAKWIIEIGASLFQKHMAAKGQAKIDAVLGAGKTAPEPHEPIIVG